jgi:hypothetical protein
MPSSSTQVKGLSSEQRKTFRERDTIRGLPNMDQDYFRDELPSVVNLEADLTDRFNLYGDLALGMRNDLEDDQVNELRISETIPVSSLDLVVPRGQTDLKRHIRGLQEQLVGEGLFRSYGSEVKVVGNLLYISFIQNPYGYIGGGESPVERGNRLHIIYDLSERMSSKSDGLRQICAFQERSSDGVVWDLQRMMPPNGEAYFKKDSLFFRLLHPFKSMLTAGYANPIPDGDGLSGKYTVKRLNAISPTFTEIAAHEGHHIYQYSNDSVQDLYPLVMWELTNLGVNFSVPLGLIGAFTLSNPWMAVIPLLSSATVYYMSRMRNNFLGEGLYRKILRERDAYRTTEMLKTLAQRNGFAVAPDFINIPQYREDASHIMSTEPDSFSFNMVYEGPIFAIVDIIMELLGFEKRGEPATQTIDMQMFSAG